MKLNYKKDLSPKYLLIALSVICIALTIVSAFFQMCLSQFVRLQAASSLHSRRALMISVPG